MGTIIFFFEIFVLLDVSFTINSFINHIYDNNTTVTVIGGLINDIGKQFARCTQINDIGKQFAQCTQINDIGKHFARCTRLCACPSSEQSDSFIFLFSVLMHYG